MGIVAGGTEGATNSTVGLELEGLHLSSRWKVAACGVLQYGCPGRALALGFRVDIESLEQVRWCRKAEAGRGL